MKLVGKVNSYDYILVWSGISNMGKSNTPVGKYLPYHCILNESPVSHPAQLYPNGDISFYHLSLVIIH